MISPPRNSGTFATLILSVLSIFLPLFARAAPQTKQAQHAAAKLPVKLLLMAHYMPWYQSKPFSGQWGWHWTMNHFDPDRVTAGREEAASQYRPLIGLYDSGDIDALKCQVLLMKLAGIDGVIIDWYGNDDYLDYGICNRNTERLIPILRQAGLRFAICYEDQTVPKEIAAGRFPASQAVTHGQDLMRWMQAHFFSNPAYLTRSGRPVLLSFGTPYYQDAQWNQIFSVLPQKPLYLTEQDRREPTASVGGFDWPAPSGGTEAVLRSQDGFSVRAKQWPLSMASAFPRFADIYAEAKVSPSWGHVEDQNGRTYVQTLDKAMQSNAPMAQIVTWNDWGEGTQVEPSVEFGYRDLEATQRLRRKYQPRSCPYTTQDLRLPVAWYLLKKKHIGERAIQAKLDSFFPLVTAGRLDKARALLASCGG